MATNTTKPEIDKVSVLVLILSRSKRPFLTGFVLTGTASGTSSITSIAATAGKLTSGAAAPAVAAQRLSSGPSVSVSVSYIGSGLGTSSVGVARKLLRATI